MMKVDSKVSSEASLTRGYPKFATIITILVSALTFTIYFVAAFKVTGVLRFGNVFEAVRQRLLNCSGA